MSSKIAMHLRTNVIGYVALFFSLGLGTAWALERNSVRSQHIVDNQVKSGDVRDDDAQGGGLRGIDIAADSLDDADIADDSPLGTAEIDEDDLFNDNSLSGGDIDEGSLNAVPSAFNAVNAQNATNAQSAVNAQNSQNAQNADFADDSDQVDGLGARSWSFTQGPQAPNNEDVMDLGGLDLQVRCSIVTPGDDNVEVVARTTTANSWIQAVAKEDGGASHGTTVQDEDFNPGEAHEMQTANDGTGYFVYRAGIPATGSGGSIVSGSFAYDEDSGCNAMGTGLGGNT